MEVGRQVDEVTCLGGVTHLSLSWKCDQIKMRDYMESRGIASFWLAVGLADFHFHISWKLHAWLVGTNLSS